MRFAACLILLSTLCFAQDKPQPAPASLAGAPLVSLERQLLGAEKSQNFAFIESSLANDFQYIAADGRQYTKPEILAELRTIHVDNYTANNLRAWLVRDEVGIVTYEIASSGSAKGQPFTFHAVMSSTWRRQKDRWQMVFHTATPLPQPPVSAAELEGLEQDLTARQSSRDADWLRRIFADDAVLVGPDGKRSTKAEAVQSILDTPATPTRISDLSARAMGPDSGVVVSHVDVQSDRVLPYTVTTVWRRGPAGWQVVSHQYTRVEK